MHVNSTLCPGCGHLLAESESYSPPADFWCGVSKTAPKLSVDYPFTIGKCNNYSRKKQSDLRVSTTKAAPFQVFFKKITRRYLPSAATNERQAPGWFKKNEKPLPCEQQFVILFIRLKFAAGNRCFYGDCVMASLKPRVSVEYGEKATIITFTDEKILEERDIIELQESLMGVIEQSEKISLILDFANVKFLSSAVLGLLIRVSKKIYEQDGQLRLCNISPRIYEIFKITRLTKIFDILPDRAAAASSFTNES
jgi:anti-sigma B factor antagonist